MASPPWQWTPEQTRAATVGLCDQLLYAAHEAAQRREAARQQANPKR